jgi:hypothetical protein
MTDSDLGTATIVYDHPEDGTVEETVENEHLVYFQDHWLVKRDEDDQGNDRVRRIPLQRVHYVDRSVDTFEDEIGTVRKQVENVANDIRSKLLGGGPDGDSGHDPVTGDPVEIDVTDDSSDDSDDTAGASDTDD